MKYIIIRRTIIIIMLRVRIFMTAAVESVLSYTIILLYYNIAISYNACQLEVTAIYNIHINIYVYV